MTITAKGIGYPKKKSRGKRKVPTNDTYDLNLKG